MNYKILFGIIASLLLTLSTVTALTMPHPVYGVIKDGDTPLAGVQIQYNNYNTGNEFLTVTTSNGFYQFELANVDPEYRNGDSVRIALVSCIGAADCSVSETLSGGANRIDFNVADVIDQITYICSDGSQVADLDDCPTTDIDLPICEDCICTPGECEDIVPCEVCLECEECPEDDDAKFPWLILICSIIGSAGAATGVTYYVRKDYNSVKGVTVKTRLDRNGNEVITHYHRGLRNYHDPKVSHNRESWERHPKGCLYPKYERNPLKGNRYEFIPVKK